MKTKLGSLRRKVANALLVTLFMMLILAVSIAGYMAYVQQQNKLGTRSQTWNMAMAVAEAGVEEGLEVLNSGVTNGPPAPYVFTGSGWTDVGNSNYVLGPRNLPGGYYYVTNDMHNWLHPVITSRGFVQMPAMAKAGNQPFFATAGTPMPMLTRAVQLQAFKGSIYLAAMAARNDITMNGNNGLVNSFDDTASNGLYSLAVAGSNGSVASLNGIISVGNYDIYGNLYVGPTGQTNMGPNGLITGTVYQDANFTFPDTSPPSTSGYFGPSIPGGTNVVLTSGGSTNLYYSPPTTTPPTPTANQTMTTNTIWFTNSSPPGSGYTVLSVNTNLFTTTNITYVTNCGAAGTKFGKTQPPPSVCCPGTTATQNGANWYYTPISGIITNPAYTFRTNVTYIYASYIYTLITGPSFATNVYDHVICGDYYITSASALSGSTLVTCPSILVAENGLSLSGQDQITISPPPPSGDVVPSLALYSQGNVDLEGRGLVNSGGFAEDFSMFCTTNVTSVTIGGNGQFIGTVIAPDATITLHGGGNNFTNVIGSLMSENINVDGHFQFHYPMSLSRDLGTGRYLVTAWKEIP